MAKFMKNIYKWASKGKNIEIKGGEEESHDNDDEIKPKQQ